MHAIMVEKWVISILGGRGAALPIVRRCPVGYVKVGKPPQSLGERCCLHKSRATLSTELLQEQSAGLPEFGLFDFHQESLAFSSSEVAS